MAEEPARREEEQPPAPLPEPPLRPVGLLEDRGDRIGIPVEVRQPVVGGPLVVAP
jgi:hypothetical protein